MIKADKMVGSRKVKAIGKALVSRRHKSTSCSISNDEAETSLSADDDEREQ